MKPLTTPENEPSWLEKVWMEVQAEIEYETKYPQGWEVANCGCVHHAEQGIPCPHDRKIK